jgi:Kip1 ubiquitination-promoting complex protein 2
MIVKRHRHAHTRQTRPPSGKQWRHPENTTKMRLHVLGLSSGGAKELSSVAASDTVDALKKKLFEGRVVDVAPAGQRLIYGGRTLADGDELLSDAGVIEGGVVVVMRRRGGDGGREWDQRERNKPVPDLSLINRMMEAESAGLGVVGGGGRSAPHTPQAAGGAPPAVEESFQGLRLDSPAAGASGGMGITLPEPDASAMAQLLEMGFPEARARKALLLNRNHPRAAMEWLLEVGDGPEADTELTDAQIRQLVNASGGGGQPTPRRRREASAAPEAPEEATVQRLVEMGFPREDVLAALAATHNDHDAACAWLLGERGGSGAGAEHPPHSSPAEQDGTPGDPGSMHMLLGDILSHPAIQQGMQSERVLQAFQAMIEDPSSAHDYLNDPEVGPILLRVHSILSRVAEQRNNLESAE